MANTITEVRLLNVPLTNDYKHTLYFERESDQANYFKGKSVAARTFTNCSYQRQDHFIRVPMEYSKIVDTSNYVMYQNKAYSNKWFYAFITKVEYVNDGLSNVYIETDVIQTWLFDYYVMPSFIEREHVNNDRVGLHTVPESVELGDYLCVNKIQENLLTNFVIVVGSTVDLTGAEVKGKDMKNAANVGGTMYGRTYSGIRYWAYPIDNWGGYVDNILENLAEGSKSDAISCIFMCPKTFLNVSDSYEVLSSTREPVMWNVCDLPSTLGDYKTIRNKKLLTYPYCYMMVSNNAGASGVYKYELFDTTSCQFNLYGCITPGFSCRMVPLYYHGIEEYNEEGLTLGKYPICNWNTDVYTNWLTQNSINIGTQLVSSGISNGMPEWLLSAISVGSDLLGVEKVSNSISETYAHSLQPPQAEGNLNSGDVTFSMDNIHFTAYQMCIKPEYAAIIDGYFDVYGYKVNQVKYPNKDHRTNYWYTKTIDANVRGALPQDDLKRIKDCYNRGITFWKNPDVIGDYSVTNIIV